MQKPNPPVSLADLSAAGIRLRPYEAVTIVRELILQAVRHEIAGVPSAHVIRLSGTGSISVEGPVGAGGPSVGRAAQLLDSLLQSGDGSQRVPGSLRLVVARAVGNLDLPPFYSLESFAEALERFASTSPAETVSNLVAAWAEFVASRAPQSQPGTAASNSLAQVEQFVAVRGSEAAPQRELTVSDIRRARRATGLTLAYIAEQTEIPLALLRQLEWGYFLNWPTGRSARVLLTRYARAAGLDEELVLATISPMMLEADRSRSAMYARKTQVPRPAAEPVFDVQAVRVPREPVPASRIPSSRLTKALAALAMPALLVIALLPAWWASSSREDVVPARPPNRADPTPLSDPATAPPASGVTQSDPEVDTAESSPPVDGQLEEETHSPTPTTGGAPPTGEPTTGTGTRDEGRQTDPPVHERSRPIASDGIGDTSLRHAGTAMFYTATTEPGDGLSGIVPARADSRDAVLRITRIVDDESSNLNLRVAPDGQRIAFDSDRDGIRGVYVADRDGRNVRRVSGDGFGAIPSWSPDGRMLAFVRGDASRPNVWNIWTLDLNTGELQQVTDNPTGQPRGASWFPDGARIAYCYGDRLVVRDLRTGVERVYEPPRRTQRLRSAAVSPDGRRVAFQIERDGAWLLELSDGSMRRVIEDPTAEEFTWSPDGRQLAYHSAKSDTWGVWVMAPRQP